MFSFLWKFGIRSSIFLLFVLPPRITILGNTTQGVRERARVPQLVMLCRWWAHLQCFAGRTGRTHGTTAGYCVAGKRAQYRNIRPTFKVSNTRALSLTPCTSASPQQPSNSAPSGRHQATAHFSDSDDINLSFLRHISDTD